MCGADVGIFESLELTGFDKKSKVSVGGDNIVILGLGASGTAAAQLADQLGHTVLGVAIRSPRCVALGTSTTKRA